METQYPTDESRRKKKPGEHTEFGCDGKKIVLFSSVKLKFLFLLAFPYHILSSLSVGKREKLNKFHFSYFIFLIIISAHFFFHQFFFCIRLRFFRLFRLKLDWRVIQRHPSSTLHLTSKFCDFLLSYFIFFLVCHTDDDDGIFNKQKQQQQMNWTNDAMFITLIPSNINEWWSTNCVVVHRF